jgi:dipeptidyl aminopeptidase/acylaminoacyl peptidase
MLDRKTTYSFWSQLVFLAIGFSFSAACSATATSDDDDSLAYEQPESPQERNRVARDGAKVYRSRVVPNWIDGTPMFWYRNELPQGGQEFIVVDASKGSRDPAFDHAAVANAMGPSARHTHLPINRLEYQTADHSWLLIGLDKAYRWDQKTLQEVEKPKAAATPGEANENRGRSRSETNGEDSSIAFENKMKEPIEIFWLSGSGEKTSYGKIPAATSKEQHTFGGHRWRIENAKGESLGEVTAQDSHTTIVVDGRPLTSNPPARRRPPNGNGRSRESMSPDGKWRASVEDSNVVIYRIENDERVVLSKDGSASNVYGQLTWSPDSSVVVAFREKVVEKKPVHWIRSSPPDGGRALLETRPYVLPGDPFPTYELSLFRVDNREQIKPAVDPFEHEWIRPRVRFGKEGSTFTYEQTDRGHQRFRLIEVRTQNGNARNIIEEKTDTFLWTAHTENQKLAMVQWLNESNEILYATEKYGWRQLVLIDAATGMEKRVLTPKGIVVRSVESIDESTRNVWFSACGRDGQDPYLVHYGYVSLDTGALTWLTEGNGNHSIQFSPKKDFVIDTYSRIDQAPITELRRVSDGSKVCNLETADVSELKASGWSAPEVFVSKGRDGTTDIWGIICRPKDFDPAKKYPVIEDIYAGPQSSYVPKSFSPSMRYESLTRLGFIVVKVDGMGTANRSKAFHDVCWKNLKDAGFPDRILWMQSAAAKHPELDLSRVGIYGTSAGGQNAAGAVLFHPEFYKVAVAACGCHDNRMDKASWNEQWMGYPVGPHYSECSNVDNAHRLQGKLLLIVGEMDTNVPPESTMRVADALIRADKDFDLLVVPNGGHGMGGAYGSRRMHDYFVQHLLPATTSASLSDAGKPKSTVAAIQTKRTLRVTPAQSTSVQSEVASKNKLNVSVSAPPESFFELVRDRYKDKARAFYSKYIDVKGLPVVASKEIDDQALKRTYEIVSHMLAGRPDILQAMQKNGMYLIIIGKDQVYTDMPEYSDHPDPAFQNERVRGTGGKPTSFGEENLLGLALDRYDDESIGVHEFCHTIDGALRSIDPDWSKRLRETYDNAKQKGLYETAYAGSNAGEYWAEICQGYFDCNRINNWNHGPVGTREQLKSYDPVGYELVRSIFQLDASNDWRYQFPRPLPAVEPPPSKFEVDPYYTKFCWAREFTVLGREASDESMLIANDIVRKMFAYRHDILKSIIASKTKLIVLGKNESLANLPEIKLSHASAKNVDPLARFLEYAPELNLIVVGEENLLESRYATSKDNSHLIYLLADAIYKIAATRPVDPDWEKRSRNVWQQYELRLERLDVRLDDSLKVAFEQQTAKGKWRGTQAIHSRHAYWNYGVLAYFNAVGQSPPPSDNASAIRTREDLAFYDPELFQIVNKAMAYSNHVDWRLR